MATQTPTTTRASHLAAALPTEYARELNHSKAVAFLGRIPRWDGDKAHTFALDMSYLLPTALSGLIPIIVGFIFTLLMFVALYVRMGPRRGSVDESLRRVGENPKKYFWHIPISVVLGFSIVSFMAQGCIGSAILLKSLLDAIDVIRSLFTVVSNTGFEVIDLFTLFVEKLTALDPYSEGVQKVLPALPGPANKKFDPEAMAKAFLAMKEYALDRMPNIVPLKNALEVLLGRILDILEQILRYADTVYYALWTLLFMQLVGPMVHFFEEYLFVKKVSRLWRSIPLVAYLLLPVMTSWILLGVSSAVGLVISDTCLVLKDYRAHILNLKNIPPANNALVKSGLVCIPQKEAQAIKQGLRDALRPLTEPVFADTVQIVLNVSATALNKRAEWSVQELSQLIDCKTLVDLSGSLEFIMCGEGGQSSSQGVADMWSAFFGLGITLTLAYFSSTLGVRIAWSTFVWPMPLKKKDDDEYSDSDRDTRVGEDQDIEAVAGNNL